MVALRAVTGDHDLMLITHNGTLLRTSLDQLREIGRATQGVRLIRVAEDDSVVAVAHVVSEEEECEINGIVEESVEPQLPEEPTETSPSET